VLHSFECPADEVLFVTDGQGTLLCGGDRHELRPESGVFVPRGAQYELENQGPEALRLLAIRIPVQMSDGTEPAFSSPRVCHLRDQDVKAAAAERELRIIAGPRTGLSSATHFVGYIPPGRAATTSIRRRGDLRPQG
jgi:glyoxylate utilization-related uncharacterized protein